MDGGHKRHDTVHRELETQPGPAAAAAPGRGQARLASSKKGEITRCSLGRVFTARLLPSCQNTKIRERGRSHRVVEARMEVVRDHRHHSKAAGQLEATSADLFFSLYLAFPEILKGKFNSLE